MKDTKNQYTIEQLQDFLNDPDEWQIGSNRTLAEQLLATMHREAKLLHALSMLESDDLSPRQRRLITKDARSEYSDGKVKE
jgi:hypothetical protein